MKWLGAVVLALCVATAAGGQELKIGYVDLQRALNECESGKKAREEFKKQVDKLQVDLKKQKDDLDALKAQLEKKAVLMKDEERRNLEKDYGRRLRDFERSYKDSQAELQAKDNELTGDILKELQKVIVDYGQRENYTLILENSSSAVLYGAPGADLTDKILQAFDDGYQLRKK